MFDQSPRGMPIWIWGALLGLMLIVISTGGRLMPGDNAALRQIFAAQPPGTGVGAGADGGDWLPSFDLGSLPTELQQGARDLLTRLGAGSSGRPVEPIAITPRLRVEVKELRPVADGIEVLGSITNLSSDDLLVPISAFELHDSTGTTYLAGGGASATLRSGESTSLELTVPLPEGRGLLLITNLPPDPSVQQRLIVVE
ncbi:hypothetical protein [Candidatus Chloroploca asiatica]|uniref:Uncharacterized protein n=1 Tax=Candidatus Chloroploca asiatica TaxID=1506545 RepID=A0A2H3KUR7_9CHLR|nr:hypothetical protein [Candidatus Chloroploca asiatica]PDV97617.1 hypothetical protein A9Q02_03955 [Candidatus Chloroploca asiatica]